MTDYVKAYDDKRDVYHAMAVTLAGQLRNDDHCYISKGILRWNSNDKVPPADVVALAIHLGFGLSVEAHDAARSAELADFMNAYRANPPAPDLQGMRAAFEPGTKVVNVITGQTWEL